MHQKTIFLLTFFLTTIFVVTQCKLVYLLEIFRHGAKYPSKSMTAFTDPENLKGQLTGVGQRQQYLLGSYLYHDYIVEQQLVPGKLNGRQVQVFSSSFQRAIDSAYAQSYGLFPTQESHVIPDSFPQNLLTPPFSIEQNLKKQSQNYHGQTPNFALNKGFQPPQIIVDDSLVNYCPNYGILVTQRLNEIQTNFTAFQAQHQQQITKIMNIFNVSIWKGILNGMSDLYDDVISNIFLGRELPKQFNDYDLKSLKFISDYYRLMVETGSLGETLATPLVRFISKRFNEVQLRQTEKKLTVFSCHAENIIELQAILNLTSVDCLTDKWNNKTTSLLNCMSLPDFASNLLFEVHENEETFSFDVKIKYNGEYANLCGKKSQTCQLDVFLQRITSYIQEDFEKKCGIPKNQLQKIHIVNDRQSWNQSDEPEMSVQQLFLPQ